MLSKKNDAADLVDQILENFGSAIDEFPDEFRLSISKNEKGYRFKVSDLYGHVHIFDAVRENDRWQRVVVKKKNKKSN